MIGLKKFYLLLAVSLMISSETFAEEHYIAIDKIDNATVVNVKSISDFVFLMEKNKIDVVYLQKSSNSMLINIGNTFFSIPSKGYSNVADYNIGDNAGFHNGSDYDDAKKLGFSKSGLYYFYKGNRFSSVADCMDAVDNGFGDSSSYYSAKKLGYTKNEDYKEYLEYTKLGYKTKDDWQLSKTRGFSNSSDYYKSVEQGFSNYKDYKSALDLGLNTNDEFQKYLRTIHPIEKISKEKSIEKKDAVIYYFLQLLPSGESSLRVLTSTLLSNYNKADNNLKTSIDKYINGGTKAKSSTSKSMFYFDDVDYSYSSSRISVSSFFTEENLRTLFKNVSIEEIGSYNVQTDIFRKK